MKKVTRALRFGGPFLAAGTCLLLATLAFNQLVPRVTGPGELAGARPGWYLRSGQVTADAKTVLAGIRFVMGINDSLPPALPPTSPASQLATVQSGTPLVATNTSTNLPTA